MIDQGLKKTQPIAPRKSQSQRSTGDVLRREGPFMGNKPAGSSPRSTRTCNLREFRMRTSRVDTEPLHRTRGGGLGRGRGQVLIDLLRRKIVHFPIFWWHFVPWPSIGSPFRKLAVSIASREPHSTISWQEHLSRCELKSSKRISLLGNMSAPPTWSVRGKIPVQYFRYDKRGSIGALVHKNDNHCESQ